MSKSIEDPPPFVQIVGPTDGWVLERQARTLAAKLPYSAFMSLAPEPEQRGRPGLLLQLCHIRRAERTDRRRLLYPPGRCATVFWTGRADWTAASVWPANTPIGSAVRRWQEVVHIPMGFDHYRYRPTLVLGVVGQLDTPRKGRDLVERVRSLPFVEVIATEGQLPEGQLRDLYQRVDYVLIPATIEGGPMCLLEGLGMGKPVIAPDGVGLVPEFQDVEHIRHYPAGDPAALIAVVKACYEEKRGRAKSVQGRTWDAWAEDHHRLFMRLLRERGVPVPRPGPGFRFGMMSDLEITASADTGPLESAVDLAAAHLFFGRQAEARRVLAEARPRYPCLDRLIDWLSTA